MCTDTVPAGLEGQLGWPDSCTGQELQVQVRGAAASYALMDPQERLSQSFENEGLLGFALGLWAEPSPP